MTRRRYYGFAMVLAVAIVSVTTVTAGIRLWVYNEWIEYKLICTYSDYLYYEIDLQPAPSLLNEFHERYNDTQFSSWTNANRPYKWDENRLYLRPWYYLRVMGNSINITEYIAKDSLEGPYSDALGSGLNYYYCRNLYNNENLFILDPNRDDPTEYIEIQDYAWLLTTLAPPPPVN